MYNDNTALLFQPSYGFNPDTAYGPYSPVATPLPSIMLEGQYYPSQQISFSSYYPQHGPPGPSAVPVPPSELMTSENSGDNNVLFGPGSGYLVPFGSFGVNVPGNSVSGPLTSAPIYPQPMGILGSYEHNDGQVHFIIL